MFQQIQSYKTDREINVQGAQLSTDCHTANVLEVFQCNTMRQACINEIHAPKIFNPLNGQEEKKIEKFFLKSIKQCWQLTSRSYHRDTNKYPYRQVTDIHKSHDCKNC